MAQAASVLLTRGPDSPDILIVRRAANLRFFGGFLAFPGGKLSAADADVPLVGAEGTPGQPFSVRVAPITAARELFEETGVLLARQADGSFPLSSPELDHLRREMMDGQVSFGAILGRLGLSIWAADFSFLGSLVTPPFSSLRFDTAFFVAHLPPHQQAVIWPGELEEGRWTTAAEVLEQWEHGECLVSPPTVTTLQAIRGQPVSEAPVRLAPWLRALAEGAIPPIDYAPDVRLIPLHTLSLPLSTYTNAYLVGRGPVYLLDPGTTDAAEQARLFQVLDDYQASGRRLTAIILTHHHPDHVGAATACAEKYRVPTWAHALTAQALRNQVVVTRELCEGEQLPLGTAADGTASWHLQALYTPGHARGHLAFYEPHYRLLFAGDMVSTLSSVVIAPPEGDLQVYLHSLRRLQSLPSRLLLPGHGSASARPRQTIQECLDHRASRELQLLEALTAGPRPVAELTLELYKGLPAPLLRFAELQVLAGLLKLEQEGRVMKTSSGHVEAWGLKPVKS